MGRVKKIFLATAICSLASQGSGAETGSSRVSLKEILSETNQSLSNLAPGIDLNRMSPSELMQLRTAPPANKPAGAFNISGAVAVAAQLDQLRCKILNNIDCSNLPVAKQVPPFLVAGSLQDYDTIAKIEANDATMFSFFALPAENKPAWPAHLMASRSSLAVPTWACVKPNPVFRPEGTPIDQRMRLEEYTQKIDEAKVGWDREKIPQQQRVVALLEIAEALFQWSPQDSSSSRNWSSMSDMYIDFTSECSDAGMANFVALEEQQLLSMKWPARTMPAGALDEKVFPLIEALVKDDFVPTLEFCLGKHDGRGRCDKTASFAITGTGRFCESDNATCVRAIRVVNAFGNQWQSDHRDGWVNFEPLAAKLKFAPLPYYSITWFQGYGRKSWENVPGVNDDIDTETLIGTAPDRSALAAEFARIHEDPRQSTPEQLAAETVRTLDALRTLNGLKVDFDKYQIDRESILSLKTVPPARTQGVIGICYSAAASAQLDQLTCWEKGTRNCQTLPIEQQVSVIATPTAWRYGKVQEVGDQVEATFEALKWGNTLKASCVRQSDILSATPATFANKRKNFEQFQQYFETNLAKHLTSKGEKRIRSEKSFQAKIKALLGVTISIDQVRDVFREDPVRSLTFPVALFRILVDESCAEASLGNSSGGAFDRRHAYTWPSNVKDLKEPEKLVPVLQSLIRRDLMPALGFCPDLAAAYGRCKLGHAWTFVATANACARDAPTECIPVMQVMNWWGDEWAKQFGDSWVDANRLLHLVGHNDFSVSWVQGLGRWFELPADLN